MFLFDRKTNTDQKVDGTKLEYLQFNLYWVFEEVPSNSDAQFVSDSYWVTDILLISYSRSQSFPLKNTGIFVNENKRVVLWQHFDHQNSNVCIWISCLELSYWPWDLEIEIDCPMRCILALLALLVITKLNKLFATVIATWDYESKLKTLTSMKFGDECVNANCIHEGVPN